MPGEKTKRLWSHPVSTNVIVSAVVLGGLLSAVGAPPLTILLWGWAFYVWRKREQAEQAALGGTPAQGALPAADGPHPLAEDPRSAWAYRRFLGGVAPGPVSPVLAARVLAMIQPGDHVELIGDAHVWNGWQLAKAHLASRPADPAQIVFRTLRGWIIANRRTGRIATVAAGAKAGRVARTPDNVGYPASGWVEELTTMDRSRITVKVFLDTLNPADFDIMENGAGPHIRRLPETPEVPAAPDPMDLVLAGAVAVEAGLPTDWQAAERIAAAHMREIGFGDAKLTGAGRDGGIDVLSGLGVAQVKMQAQPVGAPPVQQLRGARPDLSHHLFYSTSGYTSAAAEAADRSGVSLFKITAAGVVTAVNDSARDLVRTAAIRSSLWSGGPDTEQWAQGIADRVMAAVNATDPRRAVHRERFPGQWKRVAGYQMAALKSLDDAPKTFDTVQSAIVYFHHAELLAAVYFRELGIPYPGGAGDAIPDTLDEFYR